jgi:hypothetical protein
MLVVENYKMDPETEILLESGELLRNGMNVLIAETPESREYSDGPIEDDDADALRYRRWCTVSKVQWLNGRYEPYSTVEFYADYGNDEVVRRVEKVYFKWLVKINSTPEYKRQKELFDLVRSALVVMPYDNNDADNLARDVTKKITDLFKDN